MKIHDTHLNSLEAVGYTETEARFLTSSLRIPATSPPNSSSILPSSGGDTDHTFAEKLLSNRHASAEIYGKNARVYHLFSRRIYSAVGKDDIRNRRKHEFSYIESRLLALSFILAHQQHDYFETESDKLRYFCDRLSVPKEELPTKVYFGAKRTSLTWRYFVDKFPMFLSDSGTPPVVSFTYIASGSESLRALATHLHKYLPLFRRLKQFNFLFLSPYEDSFARASAIFASLVKDPLESSALAEITRCFQIRKQWESKQFAGLKHEDVQFLNQTMRRFSEERFQRAYQGWCSGTLSDADLASVFADFDTRRQIDFATCVVKPPRFVGSMVDGSG